MEMIEEIKKALAKAENTQAYYESKKTHDWLQYLIGEVERSEKEASSNKEQMRHWHWYNKFCDERQKTEELRKALEGLVILMKLTGQLLLTEEYRNACKILEATSHDTRPTSP